MAPSTTACRLLCPALAAAAPLLERRLVVESRLSALVGRLSLTVARPCGVAVVAHKRVRTIAALVVAVAVAAASCAKTDEPAPSPIAELAAESLAVGGAPWGVAVDGPTVWVSDLTRATLITLDAASGRPTGEVATGAPDPRDAGLAVDRGRVWVANLGGSVGVVDGATRTPTARVSVGPGEPAAVAVGGGWVWVPLHGPGGGLARIAVEQPAEAESIALPESGFALAVDGATVWVAGLDRGLFAVDIATGRVLRSIDLPGAPRGVAVAAGDVWVSLRDRREVVRVDAATGKVLARIATSGAPWPIAAGAGSVWVAELEGRLLRIDPGSNRIVASGTVGEQPRAIAVGGGRVWVASQSGVVTRVDAA